MRSFRHFLQVVDTPGGYLILLLILLGVGIVMEVTHTPKGEDILVGSFGALLARMAATTRSGAERTRDTDVGKSKGVGKHSHSIKEGLR